MSKITSFAHRNEPADDRDPLRAELAAAIGAAEIARAALAQSISSVASAKDLLATARDNLEAAQVAVAAARKQQASHLAQRLSGSSRPPMNKAVDEAARRKEEHAAYEIGVAQDALAQLEESFADVREAAVLADVRVEAAIAAISADAGARLLARVREAKIQFLMAAASVTVLARIQDRNMSSSAESRAHQAAVGPLWALRKSSNWNWVSVSNAHDHDDEATARIEAARSAWKAAIERLKTDPNAELPSLP